MSHAIYSLFFLILPIILTWKLLCELQHLSKALGPRVREIVSKLWPVCSVPPGANETHHDTKVFTLLHKWCFIPQWQLSWDPWVNCSNAWIGIERKCWVSVDIIDLHYGVKTMDTNEVFCMLYWITCSMRQVSDHYHNSIFSSLGKLYSVVHFNHVTVFKVL